MTPTLIAMPYLKTPRFGLLRVAMGSAAGLLIAGLGLGALSHGQALRIRSPSRMTR